MVLFTIFISLASSVQLVLILINIFIFDMSAFQNVVCVWPIGLEFAKAIEEFKLSVYGEDYDD